MPTLSDDELMAALQQRLDSNQRALTDLTALTTKLELMNARLKESEALKGHFLSNIRNEINNPLTSIMGLSRQMVDTSSDASNSSLAAVIYNEAFILDYQLRNIFIAAELEAGETDPDIAQVDISSLIKNTLEQFYHLAEKKNLSISIANDDAPTHPVPLDPNKVELILNNLIANAIEFNLPNGDITIKNTMLDDSIKLSISDTGVGIPKDKQQSVFDRFYQLDTGSKKEHRGHGLGLSIVKALTELMGGTIEITSSPGEGCHFDVTIPIIDTELQTDTLATDGNMFIFDDILEF